MTDRELINLAAKAIGYWDYEFNCYKGPLSFDPLTDDGDALRLAVKLNLLVDVSGADTTATNGAGVDENELHNGDPYAATRRAIVRAAAAIGKAA